MSKLKDYDIMDIEAMDDERLEKSESGKIQVTRVYIKSEADKVIVHEKYKRCLAMADFCESQHDYYNTLGNGFWLVRGDIEKRDEYRKKASDFWWKWHKRWFELAEKFKEAK